MAICNLVLPHIGSGPSSPISIAYRILKKGKTGPFSTKITYDYNKINAVFKKSNNDNIHEPVLVQDAKTND